MTSVEPADYARLLKDGMEGYRLVHSHGLTKEKEFKSQPGKSFAILMVENQLPRLLPDLLKGVSRQGKTRDGGEERVNLKKHRTFVYLPHQEHAKAFNAMDVQKQTIPGSAGHLSVYLDKKTGRAIVTQLQSNASPASGEHYDEHAGVRKTHASCTRQLIKAVRDHLAVEGYSLHFLDPRWYAIANKPEVRQNAKTKNEAWLIETGIRDSYDRAIAGCNANPEGATGSIEHAFGFKANLEYRLYEVPKRAYRRR